MFDDYKAFIGEDISPCQNYKRHRFYDHLIVIKAPTCSIRSKLFNETLYGRSLRRPTSTINAVYYNGQTKNPQRVQARAIE